MLVSDSAAGEPANTASIAQKTYLVESHMMASGVRNFTDGKESYSRLSYLSTRKTVLPKNCIAF